MEAAHITWRPLGQLLVERGLLTGDELERALAEQQTTGQRLGETIVKLGFVSGPELASALAAQYGIELTTEKGFGTGLRSEIQRRHESDRKRVVELVPELGDTESEPEPATGAEIYEFPPPTEPEPQSAETALLAQLEEQWARLAAAEAALAERERELTELTENRELELVELVQSHERELAERADRERELGERAESRERELAELTDSYQSDLRRLEELVERLREQREPEEPAPVAPASHLVFVHLDERYELISREGPPPAQSTPLELPDVEEGMFVVAGRRSSPLPGDERPCVFVQRG